MAFEYCCFISYSHNEGDLPKRFVKDLYNTLSGEIGALTRDIQTCCVDWERLKGGDFYNESLERAVCKSACMIMVYTPTYFDKNHTYCAKEYLAMEKIESERLLLLDGDSDDHGLIIPIVYRGERLLHQFIKDKRTLYDFSSYFPGKRDENSLLSHEVYAPQIKGIAEYVYERYQQLNELWDMSKRCKDFRFPSDQEVQNLLDIVCTANQRMQFPGRKKQT